MTSYQTLVKIEKDDAWIHQKLGDALSQRSKIDINRALECYRQAIQLNPDEISNYHKAIEIQSNDVTLYLKLSSCLLKKNQINQAIIFCQIAKQIEPENDEVKRQLNKILNLKI